MHRDRASSAFSDFDFLKREACEQLADRLQDITRTFPQALELGAHTGTLAHILNGRGGIEHLIQCDLSQPMIQQAPGQRVVCDEEWLPFGNGQFDSVFSVLSLHWVNDLPGALIQIQRALKPDGLFIAVVPGANTLKELRASMIETAGKSGTGFAPSLSPLLEIRDAGSLLGRAGFALPVIDSDTITVTYESPFKLFRDLRGMGESNALMLQHKGILPRRWWLDVATTYLERFGAADGTIPASFELITMTGWKPHESQQKPLPRGSGKVSLKDVL